MAENFFFFYDYDYDYDSTIERASYVYVLGGKKC